MSPFPADFRVFAFVACVEVSPVLCSVTELSFVAQGLLDGAGFCEGEGFVLGAVLAAGEGA